MSLKGPPRAGGGFRWGPEAMLLSNFARFPELPTPVLSQICEASMENNSCLKCWNNFIEIISHYSFCQMIN